MGDFSFGFRPVMVELDAAHSTGKMSFRSTKRMADVAARPVPSGRWPSLEERCAAGRRQDVVLDGEDQVASAPTPCTVRPARRAA